jgi:hypothetical protein
MIWATLIFLGIPIWLVLGALGGGLISRHRFQKTPGVFPMRTRDLSGEGQKWSGKMHALWVHDVLLANKGFALVRTVPHGVQQISRHVSQMDASTVKGLGDDPVSLVVVFDDGTEVEIATDADFADAASGPFSRERPVDG